MDDAKADTLAATDTNGSTARLGRSTFARTTVLPGPTHVEEHSRYEPLRTIGEGGMGEVVLVRDHDIGRQVAVKRLKASANERSAVLRFAEEVRTVGLLEHPGIVPIHDVGVDEAGQHYLVMKYVEGETLENIIERIRDRDPETLARYPHSDRAALFLSLLKALRYAHQKGVLHRDLKPANVMIGKFGEVMLMDWGIAKRSQREASDVASTEDDVTPDPDRLVQTAAGSLLGTPMYMSPEQAMGRKGELDARSDIYSASLLFLELMTGEHPYASKRNLQELILAQLKEPVGHDVIRKLAAPAGMPMEYAYVIQRGLEKDPANRYASVEEMENELRAIASGKCAIRCHVTFGKRAGQEALGWIDRHPLAYTVIFFGSMIALLGAMALGVVSMFPGR